MSFSVTFYTFSKKSNSTARPSGSGTSYNCTGKLPISLTAPRLQFRIADGASDNPTAWNYAYVPAFSRYYFVTEWTNAGPIWEASLRVDTLASWKTDIGAASMYVYRSSYRFNRRVGDSAYPQKVVPNQTVYTLPKPWTVGGTNAAGDIFTTAHIIAGIISGNGTKYYAFTPANWTAFFNGLFSNAYYNAVLSTFGATEYPEAKTVVDPLQYIASAVYVPLGVGSGNYQIPYSQQVDRIKVGTVTVGSTVPASFTAYEVYTTMPDVPWTYTITGANGEAPALAPHPQAAVRGDWLNFSPYTDIELFYPPLGVIQLDPDVVSNVEQLVFRVYMDYKAAQGMLEVVGKKTSFPQHERQLFRGQFSIGASILLNNVLTPGSSASSRASYSAASRIFGNGDGFAGAMYNLVSKIPVVGGMFENGVSSYVHGQVPHLSTNGSNGTVVDMGGTPQIVVNHWVLADEDNASKGRPLCEVCQISTVPGFITACPDDLSLSCTAAELQEIKSAINTGFFYE